MQQRLYQLIADTQKDELQIQELTSERNQLRHIVNIHAARNQEYHQLLHREHVAHSSTKDELAMEKRFHFQTGEVNSVLQRELEAEREHHQLSINEVCRLTRWCHHVDSLVDTMRLEEDENRKVHDRSRYIGEIIKDIELRLDKKYEDRLKEQDKQIANLQRQLNRARAAFHSRAR